MKGYAPYRAACGFHFLANIVIASASDNQTQKNQMSDPMRYRTGSIFGSVSLRYFTIYHMPHILGRLTNTICYGIQFEIEIEEKICLCTF